MTGLCPELVTSLILISKILHVEWERLVFNVADGVFGRLWNALELSVLILENPRNISAVVGAAGGSGGRVVKGVVQTRSGSCTHAFLSTPSLHAEEIFHVIPRTVVLS